MSKVNVNFGIHLWWSGCGPEVSEFSESTRHGGQGQWEGRSRRAADEESNEDEMAQLTGGLH